MLSHLSTISKQAKINVRINDMPQMHYTNIIFQTEVQSMQKHLPISLTFYALSATKERENTCIKTSQNVAKRTH